MTALIIIDMQQALMRMNPWEAETVLGNICRLREKCREKNIPVIYVRHDDGGSSALEKGTAGWRIVPELTPAEDERVFDKRFNSAFRFTGLHDHLQGMGVRKLILCGMQTEYCMDTTVKTAFERGYQVTVPRMTTTTFDNDLTDGGTLTRYYEDHIWAGRFADVVDLEALRL